MDVFQDDDNRVHFTADAAIDADGANGQSRHPLTGKPLFAYAPHDRGLDLLANAGYPNGSYQDILVCNPEGKPIAFSVDNVIGYYSSTAYETLGVGIKGRYLDSCAIPYIVVSPMIRRKAKGVVLGARARVTNLVNGRSTLAVVGDIGPLRAIGELSIAAADALHLNSSPRTGGTDEPIIKYEIWPGVSAVINGNQYSLMPA